MWRRTRKFQSKYYGENTGFQSKVSVEPAVEPITLDDVKDWMRTSLDEDKIIYRLIESVRKAVEDYCNISLITQTRIDFWETYGEQVPLSHGPHQSISSVARVYRGTETALTSNDYHTSGLDYLTLFPNGYYSTEGRDAYNLKITYVAGFGATGADVPGAIKDAMLEQIAHYYEFRQEMRSPNQIILNQDVCRKLAPYNKRDWI